MDISAKILREVEFRDRLRGYDTDEVDDFLERVAVGFDELSAELSAALARADRAEHQLPPPAPAPTTDDDDSIKRTLVLAQRTADMAVREAKEEAAQILAEARASAANSMSEAREAAEKTKSRAEQDLHLVVERLSSERARLETEVATLVGLVGSEQTRLVNTIRGLLAQIEGLGVSPEVRSAAPTNNVAPSATEAPAAATPSPSPGASPLGELLSDPDDELEPEDEEELNLHFALPDPPRPIAEDAARPADAASLRERLADPLDPDEELWDRWARTGETESIGDDANGTGPDVGRTL